MSEELKIAIVGCGGITPYYASVYAAFEWARVTVCVDADLAKAQETAAQFPNPAEIVATTDFNEALGANVNVVSINTPNHLHCEQSIAALEAGKHLLLQKPVAANLEDAEAIERAAEIAAEKGIISGLYLSYFEQPLVYDLQTMIRGKWFGDIAHLYARLMHKGGLRWSQEALDGQKNWRGSVAQTGGGCFIQLAVHSFHIFEWMLDSRIVRATAVMKNLYCKGLEGEDLACAILEFESGAIATVETAWCAAAEQISVHGTRGSAEYINNRLLMLSGDVGDFTGEIINYKVPNESIFLAPGSAFVVQNQEIIAPRLDDVANPHNQQKLFLEAVRDKQKPFVSIAAGIDDLRVVKAVYESARTGKSVEVERKGLATNKHEKARKG